MIKGIITFLALWSIIQVAMTGFYALKLKEKLDLISITLRSLAFAVLAGIVTILIVVLF